MLITIIVRLNEVILVNIIEKKIFLTYLLLVLVEINVEILQEDQAM